MGFTHPGVDAGDGPSAVFDAELASEGVEDVLSRECLVQCSRTGLTLFAVL